MTFTTDELISSTTLVRNFSNVLDKINNHDLSKVWILKNNNLEAVIFSRKEYDRNILEHEQMLEYIEDLEDIVLINERMKNDKWNRHSMEEVAKKFNIDLTSL